MKFDAWGFRKYKLKNDRREVKPSLLPNDTTEKEIVNLSPSDDNDSNTSTQESSRQLNDMNLPLAPNFQEPSVCSHNDISFQRSFVNLPAPKNLNIESTISVGPIQVPIWPVSPGDLFRCIPYSSGFQLYGLLATWRTGGAWMDHLQSLLRSENSQRMILEPPENVQLGGDFVASNYFQAVMKFVHRDDQGEARKAIFYAIEKEQTVSPRSPSWVNAWWQASHTCNWSIALDFLLQTPVDDKDLRAFLASTGQIIIAKRLLHHHFQFLVNNMDCPRPGCIYQQGEHRERDLKREYVEIIEDIAGIESSEDNLAPKYYMFALELVSYAKEELSQEAKKLRIQTQEAREREEKYCQVIVKYTNMKKEEVAKELDHLSTATVCKSDFGFFQAPPLTVQRSSFVCPLSTCFA